MKRYPKLIVTSGPTREWLDPVRFISNPSSGRMGYSIARAGLDQFEKVTYICGPGAEAFQEVDGAENHRVDTTEEMLASVLREITPGSALIMAAAPADYAPVIAAPTKIKKDPTLNLTVEFRPTPDILMEVARQRIPGIVRVAFAAETDHVRENALIKMKKKDVDFICANQVFKGDLGFASDSGALLVIDRAGNETSLGPASKDSLGVSLIEFLVTRIDAIIKVKP